MLSNSLENQEILNIRKSGKLSETQSEFLHGHYWQRVSASQSFNVNASQQARFQASLCESCNFTRSNCLPINNIYI